ncbi:hypothetical protein HZS_7523 [Henneguya salminicola]|nr:hypothetical protein HZS_7523 [Henneguya salminicola]
MVLLLNDFLEEFQWCRMYSDNLWQGLLDALETSFVSIEFFFVLDLVCKTLLASLPLLSGHAAIM